MNVASNEDATCLLPPDEASALEPPQVTTARYTHIASLADAPLWHDNPPLYIHTKRDCHRLVILVASYQLHHICMLPMECQ